MSKIIIIDIDLDINLDEIITNSAKELTAGARIELDNALKVAESARRLKEEKAAVKPQKLEGLVNVMEQAYQKLMHAGENGVAVEEILTIVQQYVPSSSAFTLRMNNILSTKGNPYLLKRRKINGIASYTFELFNATG